MWWKLLQLVVFLAVSFTGIYYQWTPNGLVLGLVAAICALHGAELALSDNAPGLVVSITFPKTDPR